MRRLLHTVKGIKTQIIYTEVDGQGTYVSPLPTITNRVYKAFPELTGEIKVTIEGGYQFIFQYKEGGTGGNVGTWTTEGTYTIEQGKTYGIAIRYPDNSNISPSDFISGNGRIIIQK